LRRRSASRSASLPVTSAAGSTRSCREASGRARSARPLVRDQRFFRLLDHRERLSCRDREPGISLVTIILTLFTWPYIARIVRGQTLLVREQDISRPVFAFLHKEAQHTMRQIPVSNHVKAGS
jgi:hypothetical protein